MAHRSLLPADSLTLADGGTPRLRELTASPLPAPRWRNDRNGPIPEWQIWSERARNLPFVPA
jgi:hypothetical protein